VVHWPGFQLDGHSVSASVVESAPLMTGGFFAIVLAGGALMGDSAQGTILQHLAFIDRSFSQYPSESKFHT
jgi:hypothetical protein